MNFACPPSAPHLCGAESSATRMSRKRNDSFGRPTPRRSAEAAARRSSLEGFRDPRPVRPDRTWDRAQLSVLFPGPESHAGPGGSPECSRRQRRRGSGPRLSAAATPLARPPRPLLPPARASQPPPPLTSARGQRGATVSAGVGTARRRRSALPGCPQAPACGTTRAEQTAPPRGWPQRTSSGRDGYLRPAASLLATPPTQLPLPASAPSPPCVPPSGRSA